MGWKDEMIDRVQRLRNLENTILAKDILIAQKEARIRELEGVIRKWFDVCPCEHEPEDYYQNADCEYCVVVLEMDNALSEKSDKSNQSDKIAPKKKVEFKFDKRSLTTSEEMTEEGRFPPMLKKKTDKEDAE